MRLISLVLLLLGCAGSAYARGGVGSTCDPSTANWATCTKATVPFAASVTNTVSVAGGTWSTPYAAGTANTKYVLQGDVTANSTGVQVTADYVIIDLNGHTLTYNQTTAGEGIAVTVDNVDHLAVINGSVIQGAAKSSGTTGGTGNACITSMPGTSGIDKGATNIFIANVYASRSGKDVANILFYYGDNSTVTQTTVEDKYTVGVITDRHNSVAAGIILGNNSTVSNCTVKKARHRGVIIGSNSSVNNNSIDGNSLDTNAYGVFLWEVSNVAVYNNTFTMYGNHPVAIGAMGGDAVLANLTIRSNIITAKRTAVCGDASGNTATGIRAGSYSASTTAYTNLRIYDNYMYIDTDDAYTGTNCETGATLTGIDGRGKGLFIGPKTTTTGYIADNVITLTGDGDARGVAPMVNTEDSMFFIRNTITSPYIHIAAADDYASFSGYPLFIHNTFIKNGTNTSYHTISDTGWESNSQIRLVDNNYQGGASKDSYYATDPTSSGRTMSWYFGSLVAGVPKYDALVYNSGTTLAKTTYSTPISLVYTYPTTCAESPEMCTTETTCQANWTGYSYISNSCIPPDGTVQPGQTCADTPTLCTEANCASTWSGYEWNGTTCTLSVVIPPTGGNKYKLGGLLIKRAIDGSN